MLSSSKPIYDQDQKAILWIAPASLGQQLGLMHHKCGICWLWIAPSTTSTGGISMLIVQMELPVIELQGDLSYCHYQHLENNSYRRISHAE